MEQENEAQEYVLHPERKKPLQLSDLLDTTTSDHKIVRSRLQRLFAAKQEQLSRERKDTAEIPTLSLQLNGSRIYSHEPDDFFVAMNALNLQYGDLLDAIEQEENIIPFRR